MWSWNILLFKEILHYAVLRSEWHGSVFYLRLGIWIIFETQRFFIIPIFLRKQSWRNSFAMKLCGNCIFSITKFSEMWWNDGAFEDSEEHWKLWRCEVEIFCFLKRFFTMLRFVQNDRVLFCSHGLKIRAIGMRYELRDASISITKFTEIGWNDCVFERTEEHQRCSGKCTGFSVYVCRKEPILL